MRYLVPVLLAAVSLPSTAFAQERKPPEVTKVHVGFQTYQKDDQTAYKVGLWTPVYVEVFGGTEGLELKANTEPPHLVIETVDSEDVGTRIRVPVLVKPGETETFIGYIKTGRGGRGSNEINVYLRVNSRDLKPHPVEQFWSLDIDAHLYLTLGPKIDDLHAAVRKLDKPAEEKENPNAFADFERLRHVIYENKVERLPRVWFGYNSVDLIVLSTSNGAFLKGLKNDPQRLGALATWVRRGGRLVVPIAHENQLVIADLLRSPVWDPAIPAAPPKVAANAQPITLERLNEVEAWGRVQGDAFRRPHPTNPLKFLPIIVATLDDGRVTPGAWEVEAESSKETGSKPLIAKVPYGLGQITYIAFSLEDPNFFQWKGKEQFLKTLVQKIGPTAPAGDREDRGFVGNRRNAPNDVATDLLAALDNFDVKVIPFGLVALFIVIYILVVGPLDFILLKYVFKRLEWTWITFPAVVLAVSVIAYFAAYALKGRDLKINKIDIVDFDMRTSSDPKNVHAYGHSFFTILSPRIQNYTVGLEPNPEFWGEPADKVRSVDLLSWLGRPSGGPFDMGRSSSAGFFRKPYSFRDDGSGLEGVPIPVWTTKAFTASWEQVLKDPPFVADLTFHKKEFRGKHLKLAGKIENRLAVDLNDVWIIYDDQTYPISQGLKSSRNGGAALDIEVPVGSNKEWRTWAAGFDDGPKGRNWSTDPTGLVKMILFHQKVDTQNMVRNHLLRSLDQGWRVKEERSDRRVREAILFARVAHANGPAEDVTRDAKLPLPTKLWLTDLPDPGKTRPSLPGHLNQDTYIRVLLTVRFADE